MPKVLISDKINEVAKNILEKNNIEVCINTNLSIEDLKKIISDFDGLIVRSATKVTKEIIESSKNLKIIGRAGAGVDNIDLESAKKRNIIVMNTPGANTNATAEHTITLILSLYRNILKANVGTHKGLWEKKSLEGFELKNKKIGLIGFGNVSRRIVQILKAFDTDIYVNSNYFESVKDKYSDITNSSLNDILSQCDIISFHCKASNKPLINAKELNLMKKNSILINTARGNLINEKDLKEALNNGIIQGAAIDVFSQEPARDNILFGCKNIILTPHIAASTKEAQINVAIMIAEQFSEYFKSGNVKNSVN